MYLSVDVPQRGSDLPFYTVTLRAIHIPCVNPRLFQQEPDVLKVRDLRLYLLSVLFHATLSTSYATLIVRCGKNHSNE